MSGLFCPPHLSCPRVSWLALLRESEKVPLELSGLGDGIFSMCGRALRSIAGSTEACQAHFSYGLENTPDNACHITRIT